MVAVTQFTPFASLAGGGLIGFASVLLMAFTFHVPSANELDARIIFGPAIFGVGWGLAGFCPGPGFTALGGGTTAAVTFVAAMLTGMFAARWLASHRSQVARALS
jgi:uncharacterized membrane protein YedE/YeeE